MLAGSLLFVLGFSVVFVALGTLSGALGAWLVTWQREITRGARRPDDRARAGLRRAGAVAAARLAGPPVPSVGLGAAPLLGLLFGLGWTPCIGPDPRRDHHALHQRGHRRPRRAAVGLLRARPRACPSSSPGSPTAARSAPSAWVRRHQQWVTRVGGLMLVAVGVLLVTGLVGRAGHLDPAAPGQHASRRASDGARDRGTGRRSGELTLRELLRWSWRQLTSMRTALVLLLLLALAAIPGSVIPQQGVDSHQDLAVAGRPPEADAGLRAARALRRLLLAVVRRDLPAADGLARRLLHPADRRLREGAPGRSRPPRRAGSTGCPTTRRTAPTRRPTTCWRGPGPCCARHRVRRARRTRVAAERGYLREAGNLLFHVSVLVVLVGFAVGSLFGYRGGVILVVGNGMSNNLTQYDDFDPGSLFGARGPRRLLPRHRRLRRRVADRRARPSGQARAFVSHVTYAEGSGQPRGVRPRGQPPARRSATPTSS